MPDLSLVSGAVPMIVPATGLLALVWLAVRRGRGSRASPADGVLRVAASPPRPSATQALRVPSRFPAP